MNVCYNSQNQEGYFNNFVTRLALLAGVNKENLK